MREFTNELIGKLLKVNGVEVTVTHVHNANQATVTANGRSWQINSAMKIEDSASRYSLRGSI